MAWVWTGCMILSLLGALITGKTAQTGAAVLEGAGKGLELTLTLAGPLCLWSGLARVMEAVGAMDGLTRALGPVLKHLFPESWNDETARKALCGNVSANLLGLGNAATPLGIQASKSMAGGQTSANDELCTLVVLNTASLQLIPTTVAALRAGLGAARPFDILPAVWVTSLLALTVGLGAARGLRRWM